MTDICISLPDELRQFVQSQVASGRYEDENEYIRALIARARRRHSRLESLLIEGLESGEPTEVTAETWDDLRKQVRSTLDARQP